MNKHISLFEIGDKVIVRPNAYEIQLPSGLSIGKSAVNECQNKDLYIAAKSASGRYILGSPDKYLNKSISIWVWEDDWLDFAKDFTVDEDEFLGLF